MVLPLVSHLIKTSGSCYKLLHSLALRQSPRLIDIPFSPYFFVSANLIQPQHFSRQVSLFPVFPPVFHSAEEYAPDTDLTIAVSYLKSLTGIV